MHSMSVNTNKLKGRIVELGLNQKDIAASLGITVQAFNAKINKRAPINLDEAFALIKILKIENPMDIFFNHTVADKQRN
jgi:DNA-binding XRE family transcriptional regulator